MTVPKAQSGYGLMTVAIFVIHDEALATQNL